MTNSDPSGFAPRWYRNADQQTRAALAETSLLGVPAPQSPQIITRLLPNAGGQTLAASAVAKVIELTQRLAHYAAQDLVVGINPNFADMRSISAEVQAFSRLAIEPFEEGSFVIPTQLESQDFETESGDQIATEQIAQRFSDILLTISSGQRATEISIGALQTVRQLNATINTAASVVEYQTIDRFQQATAAMRVDAEFMGRVRKIIDGRQPSAERLDSLTGTVTALDILRGQIQLTVDDRKQRIKGSFHKMLQPTMLESLGRVVKLYGAISYKHDQPVEISIQEAELIDEDQ
ncbi:hypothetical protein [Rosistilla oblonga]|uniref:hypothetical protein n=1 Tax=Rosistilla oblonga TaxID=2527990 RepID=UPI003A96EAF4